REGARSVGGRRRRREDRDRDAFQECVARRRGARARESRRNYSQSDRSQSTSRQMSRGDAYIGLMSGTSLDGISACVVRFAGNQQRTAKSREPTAARAARGAENGLSFELLAFEVTEYNS